MGTIMDEKNALKFGGFAIPLDSLPKAAVAAKPTAPKKPTASDTRESPETPRVATVLL